MHYRCVGNGKRSHHPTVDHDVIGLYIQSIQRTPHGEDARLVDVDAIDLMYRGSPEGERDGTLADLGGEADALNVRQSLGVIHSGDGTDVGWHYHGAGNDRTGDRTSTYFVNACEQWTLLAAQVALNGRPALPLRHMPAPDWFCIGIWSFGGRLGSARFDLFLHAVLRPVERQNER